MDTIQQRCRPKHQVLVLKCYPRTTKGAVDVKPNSSELSYLLFYALSRRSKIQKIGSFLEKKTASDVYRLRIGNVQVTLQILSALMEKSAKDVALIAPCVLKILDVVLRSGDLTMVESSIATFEAFCQHLDASSLLADLANLRQYELVVRSYASLASTRGPPVKGHLTEPVAMRWRIVGLQAIRCVAASDALSTVSGRQIDVIVPMVLDNLWSETEDALDVLVHRAQLEEKAEADKTALRRRTSIVTVRTAENAGDTNPLALSGTAHDVDKLAAEDIAVLAMQCLKQIFVVPSRSQIQAATVALLRFISDRAAIAAGHHGTDDGSRHCAGWAVRTFITVAHWAPVQDRYVILVVAMDILAKTQLSNSHSSTCVLLTTMISSLLRSDVNLIGLSVMDVLLGLVQQMKWRTQPNRPSSAPAAHHAAVDADQRATDLEKLQRSQTDLLRGVQACIGDLATHVYYADQISDMISALLAKLRPARTSSSTSSPHGEKADPHAQQQQSDHMHAEPSSHLDAYFNQGLGKVALLGAIKSILLVANPRTKMAGNPDLSRNRVPIQVWEGTDWLLRDPDGAVRKAYADALVTWLDRETTPVDTKARDEGPSHHRASLKNVLNARDLSPQQTTSRGAISSASHRERSTAKRPRSHFLSRLHVAVYDNALQYVDFESDYVLLHVLLAKLVDRLGVNAARYGLPMIFRLQEDILEAEAPIHKVRIGSLCHGYFWSLTDKFDCEDSVVGRAIHNEIVRRRSKHFWVECISVPVPALEAAGMPGMAARPQPRLPLREVESESLLPFDDRLGLVECIATGYAESTRSPPTSPSASPGRSMSMPIFASTLSGLSVGSPLAADRAHKSLPGHFQEQMLAEWSREAVLLALHDESKSESLNGSRSGTTGTNNNKMRIVSVGGANTNGVLQTSNSPHGSQANLRALAAKMRKGSVRSGVSAPPSESSRGAVATVEELKMVLSGKTMPHSHSGAEGSAHHSAAIPGVAGAPAAVLADDSGSDSMVSYDSPPSELSHAAPGLPVTPSRSLSRDRMEKLGPLTSNPPHEPAPIISAGPTPKPDVPPVPPLPTTMPMLGTLPNKSGDLAAMARAQHHHHHHLYHRSESVGPRRRVSVGVRGRRRTGSPATSRVDGVIDLRDLLLGISTQPSEGSLAAVAKPPY